MPGSLREAQALSSLFAMCKKCPNPALSQLKILHAAAFKGYCFPVQELEMDCSCCGFGCASSSGTGLGAEVFQGLGWE